LAALHPDRGIGRIASCGIMCSCSLSKWNYISDVPGAPQIKFTSKVVGPGKEYPELNWRTAVWLIPHEALRHGLITALWILQHEKFNASNPTKACAFRDWYNDFLYGFIVQHHTGEDNVASKHFPDIYGSTGVIAAQHKEFHHMVDEMKTQANLMCQHAVSGDVGGASECKNRIAAVCKKLDDQLSDHLATEELKIPVELQKPGWTEVKLNKMVNDEIVPEDVAVLKKLYGIRRTMGQVLPLQFAVLLACMEVWGGHEFVSGFYNSLPPPVKLIMSCNLPGAASKLWVDQIRLIIE